MVILPQEEEKMEIAYSVPALCSRRKLNLETITRCFHFFPSVTLEKSNTICHIVQSNIAAREKNSRNEIPQRFDLIRN